MSTAARRPPGPQKQISSMQIVFGSILAISLLLAINFSGRIAAGRRIEGQRNELEWSIQTLEAEATALRSELGFVSSDAFVEQWARGEGRLVRPNEVLIVPVPGQTTPQPPPAAPIALPTRDPDPAAQNWQLWWQIFFDDPPPGN